MIQIQIKLLSTVDTGIFTLNANETRKLILSPVMDNWRLD